MINYAHFEDLWQASEALFKNDITDSNAIVQEIIAKLFLYQSISTKLEASDEEKRQLQHHIMGTIVSTLTHLSLKDNINVFAALQETTNKLRAEKLEAALKRS